MIMDNITVHETNKCVPQLVRSLFNINFYRQIFTEINTKILITLFFRSQKTLSFCSQIRVISTSLFSNIRLSRSENMVRVLTWKHLSASSKLLWKREEIAPLVQIYLEIINSSYNVPNFWRDSLLHQGKRKNTVDSRYLDLAYLE